MLKKTLVFALFFLLTGIAASAWAQGDLVEKGKALAEKKCMLCHKQGGLGNPMEMLAGKNTDDFLKEAIKDPKKTIDPKIRMPEFKLTDEEMQSVIAYLRSVAKK
ncbi:MAG: cytochrome c [Syntrophobacteraceae bacterium]